MKKFYSFPSKPNLIKISFFKGPNFLPDPEHRAPLAGPETRDRARRRQDRKPAPENDLRDPGAEPAGPGPGLPDHRLRARPPHRGRRSKSQVRGVQRRVHHVSSPERPHQLRPDQMSDHHLKPPLLDHPGHVYFNLRRDPDIVDRLEQEVVHPSWPVVTTRLDC